MIFRKVELYLLLIRYNIEPEGVFQNMFSDPTLKFGGSVFGDYN